MTRMTPFNRRLTIAAVITLLAIAAPACIFGLTLRHFFGGGELNSFRILVIMAYCIFNVPWMFFVAHRVADWAWKDRTRISLVITNVDGVRMLPVGTVFTDSEGGSWETDAPVHLASGRFKYDIIVKRVAAGAGARA